MSDLRALQEGFLAYLLSGDTRIAGHIVDQAPVGRETRLGIYANAYRVRLKETLETDHEMLGLYLGDALWDRLADGYIDARPSHHRSLRQYGNALPDWLRHNPPFADHPQIAEVADFERRLLVSFDAADAACADHGELTTLAPTQWPGLRLRFHPSVQPFRADWNSVEIWQSLKAGEPPPDAIHQPDSWWLLWRGEDRLTQFRSLPVDERVFLQHFLEGGDFADACEQLLAEQGENAVAQTALGLLTTWLESGLVKQLVVLG